MNLALSYPAWAAYLAGTLERIISVETIEEAHDIARKGLLEAADPKEGIDVVPYEIRLRWYTTASK